MPPSTTSHSPINRLWVLEQIGGDEELLRAIAEVFMIDSPNLRQQLEASLASGDPAAVRSAAHCAKSAVGNFGAPQAVQAATALEEAAKSGDTATLPAFTEKLCTELLRVEEALRQDVLSEPAS